MSRVLIGAMAVIHVIIVLFIWLLILPPAMIVLALNRALRWLGAPSIRAKVT
jgi:hypothetical protein